MDWLQATMPNEQVDALLQGNRRALSRVLSRVERGEAHDELRLLFPKTGKAWVIGITGAPGSGKSSLVNALAKYYRADNKTLAIIAVDPTSPFSGGAILGDRIRMKDLSGDSGVFIRSMATRGNLGGLARTTRDMIRVLDAAGFDYIIVETVGAGQSEVEVARVAYTTIVVEAPGMGDDVQAIKAGILEIADILVVNKADRVGANQTVRALKAMLDLGHPISRELHHGRLIEAALKTTSSHDFWIPEVVQTVATENNGIVALAEAIAAHRTYRSSGNSAQFERDTIENELMERIQSALMNRWLTTQPDNTLQHAIEQIQTRHVDPQTMVETLLNNILP